MCYFCNAMKRLSAYLLIFGMLAATLVSCKDDFDIQPKPVTGTEDPVPGGDDPSNPGADTDGDIDLSILDSPLSKDLILTSGTWLQNASVMQSFALTGDGNMYACQVAATGEKYKLNVTYKPVTSNTGKQKMQLSLFGHGSNMVLEKAADGDYLWIGSYGTDTQKDGATYFTNNQTICRVRFEAGKSIIPEDVPQHWYIPGLKNVHPAIDFENRHLAIWGSLNSSEGYFYVYDLDEVLALPQKDVLLPLAMVRGPYENFSSEAMTYWVTAARLSDLKPVAKILLKSDGPVGTGSNQGFEIKNRRIYHYSGGGNNNDGAEASVSTVTVFNFDGKVLDQRRVMAVASMEDLKNQGITDTGFMESEGIKIYGDYLYLGYATKNSTDTKRYVTILKYPFKG